MSSTWIERSNTSEISSSIIMMRPQRKIAMHYTDAWSAGRGPTKYELQWPVEAQSIEPDEGSNIINTYWISLLLYLY
jgi:hypothetical protein